MVDAALAQLRALHVAELDNGHRGLGRAFGRAVYALLQFGAGLVKGLGAEGHDFAGQTHACHPNSRGTESKPEPFGSVMVTETAASPGTTEGRISFTFHDLVGS